MNTDKIFRQEILSRSRSKIWHEAIYEWTLIKIREIEKGEDIRCICTQHPIKEACLIHNKYTLIGVEVGNTCIEKIAPREYYRMKFFNRIRNHKT
jgi:hypothetical protein